MRDYLNLSKTEKGLIASATFVLLASSAAYFLGFSLRGLWLGEGGRQGTQVGTLASKSNRVRRQGEHEHEFRALEQKAALYTADTVVTDPDGQARIELLDGAEIDLGPSTMVKLAFDSQISLGGVSRITRVEVVSGKVTGKASPIKNAHKLILRSRKQEVTLAQGKAPVIQPTLSGSDESSSGPDSEISIKDPNVLSASLPKLPVAVPSVSPRPSPTPIPKPSPTPSPTPSLVPSPIPSALPSPVPPERMTRVKVVLLNPQEGAKFSLNSMTAVAELKLPFSWRISGLKSTVSLVVIVKKLDKDEELGLKEIARTPVKRAGTHAQSSVVLNAPGVYQWELLSIQGQGFSAPGARGRFSLSREFTGIQVLPPLIGGKETLSNVYNGDILDDFEITLRWKAFQSAEIYFVKLFDSADSTHPARELKIKELKAPLGASKVINGQIFFSVSAALPSGFVVTSGRQKFAFNFLGPDPKAPLNHARVPAPSKAGPAEDGLLFTWQKTNFTEAYEFELARDPGFKSIVFTKGVDKNFLILDTLRPGTYYWRVRSQTGIMKSPFSKPFQIIVF